MQEYRPDRVVRVLTTVVSIAYFVMGGLTVLALIMVPAMKLLAGDDRDWMLGLGSVQIELPSTAMDSVVTVPTTWGPAQLEVEDVRADLRMPIVLLPWSIVATIWLMVATGASLIVLSLYHLRRIFQRVREGAPFDAHNAVRLRWLGLLLLALAVLAGIVDLVTSLVTRAWLARNDITVAMGLHMDGSLVFVALVLIALAEIFRRGAELEQEQSLVV